MQAPSTKDGRGTSVDPWRPKYARELGLAYTGSVNMRSFIMADFSGDRLAEFIAQPDVIELKSARLDTDKLAALDKLIGDRGETLDKARTGQALIDEVKRATLEAQRKDTPERLAALFEALRGK